jgi:hypothetical protein
MPMREDCKHYQSRSYSNGETARFCVLDLAPEAPWRCPDDCPRYERRMVDSGFTYGSLAKTPPTPELPGELPPNIAELLDNAEDIVNAVVPELLAEQRRIDNESKSRRRWFWQKRRG